MAYMYIVGEGLRLNYTFSHFDKILHVIGGVVAGWLALIWTARNAKLESGFARVIISVALVVLIGVLWEFAEYYWDNIVAIQWPFLAPYFGGGGLSDTISDLLCDLVGGAIAAVAVFNG